MKLVMRIALGALAGATMLTGIAATPALAHPDSYIGYHDRDYRRDRDWRRHDRYDRYDRRWDRRSAYGYRQRCWTDWRYDRWRGRYAVRVCR